MTTEHVTAPINAWHVAQQQFDLAADRLNLDPGLRRVLREPRRELTVHFPVQMDDGIGPGVHRLSRPAQPRPRSGQGRHPLPPGREPRRGQGPRDVDDLEVRGRRHPVRRRQGRRDRRPEAAVDEGARAPDPPLHRRDRGAHRPGARHPRAGREHQRPGHGLDDGHLLDARRVHGPGRGHRQADQPRRLRGPQRGHGPRLRLHGGRGRAPHRPGPHRGDGRGPGLRQRRLDRGQADVRGGLDRHRGVRLDGRHPERERARHRSRARLEEGARDGQGLPRRRGRHQRGAPRDPVRRPDPGRAREPDHREQRRTGSRPGSSPRPRTARRPPRPTRSCGTTACS